MISTEQVSVTTEQWGAGMRGQHGWLHYQFDLRNRIRGGKAKIVDACIGVVVMESTHGY